MNLNSSFFDKTYVYFSVLVQAEFFHFLIYKHF